MYSHPHAVARVVHNYMHVIEKQLYVLRMLYPVQIDREREDDVQVHSKFEGKTLPYATQSFMVSCSIYHYIYSHQAELFLLCVVLYIYYSLYRVGFFEDALKFIHRSKNFTKQAAFV